MATKSRLGKGLGALFPALPGELSEDTSDGESTPQIDAEQKPQDEHKANVSRETLAKKTPRKKVSVANNSNIGGTQSSNAKIKSAAGYQETASVKATTKKAAKNKKPGTHEQTDADKTEKAIVSRETIAKRKRRSIPSVASLKHPSDLFFEQEAVAAKASSQADKEVKSGSRRQPANEETTLQNNGFSEQSDVRNSSSANGVMDSNERDTDKNQGTHLHKGKDSDKQVQQRQSVNSAKQNSNTVIDADTVQDGVAQETSDTEQADVLKPVQGGYLVELRLDQIGPNEYQPRTIFDEDDLRELAASLKEVGVLQPIVVRRRKKNSGSTTAPSGSKSADALAGTGSEYELIMGERRWRAAHLAGLESVPAIVKTTSDDDMLRDALLENLHRVALNPLEEAAAYQQMMDDFGLTQEKLSKSISKSRSQIANTLRLLNLPPSVQKKVGAGVLSAGHARALLGLQSADDMDKLAKRILQEGLSVRSTEEIVAMKTNGGAQVAKKSTAKRKNPWSESPVAQRLEDRFDTKVSIKGSKKRGRIEIVFSSPDDMNRILNLLAPEEDQTSHWV